MVRIALSVLIAILSLVACHDMFENYRSSAGEAATQQQEQAEVISGRVVRVIDGDTVSVLDRDNTQHRIRLAQIDAPESKQAYSKVAKDALAALIANKEVQVRVQGNDRYKRVLGEIYLGEQNINLHLVRQGYAWAYEQYVTDKRYIEAQQQAQRERLGLWRDPHAVAPWEYRRQQRQKR